MNINKIVTPDSLLAEFRPIGVCKTPRGTKAKIVETTDGY